MRTIKVFLFVVHATLVVLEMYAKTTAGDGDDKIISHLLSALNSLDELI